MALSREIPLRLRRCVVHLALVVRLIGIPPLLREYGIMFIITPSQPTLPNVDYLRKMERLSHRSAAVWLCARLPLVVCNNDILRSIQL